MSLICADARALPLADRSVHCVVTSPPYWGLRDYGTTGQIGLESTPDAYVAELVAVFREVWRVLKDDGVPLNNSLANLAWVTHKENVGHQVLHGTQRRGAAHHWSTDARRGERHSRARLSAAEVEEIRALRAAGVRVVEIASRFGIHVRHAYAVAGGEFWR